MKKWVFESYINQGSKGFGKQKYIVMYLSYSNTFTCTVLTLTLIKIREKERERERDGTCCRVDIFVKVL